jgi:hypothetical protein
MFPSQASNIKFEQRKKISLGISAVDSNGRTIWIADAHRDDGKRFVVRSDEKLTAFLALVRQSKNRRRVPMFGRAYLADVLEP